jgi:hypothetical protein
MIGKKSSSSSTTNNQQPVLSPPKILSSPHSNTSTVNSTPIGPTTASNVFTANDVNTNNVDATSVMLVDTTTTTQLLAIDTKPIMIQHEHTLTSSFANNNNIDYAVRRIDEGNVVKRQRNDDDDADDSGGFRLIYCDDEEYKNLVNDITNTTNDNITNAIDTKSVVDDRQLPPPPPIVTSASNANAQLRQSTLSNNDNLKASSDNVSNSRHNTANNSSISSIGKSANPAATDDNMWRTLESNWVSVIDNQCIVFFVFFCVCFDYCHHAVFVCVALISQSTKIDFLLNQLAIIGEFTITTATYNSKRHMFVADD